MTAKPRITRRRFLQQLGAAGVGTTLTPLAAGAASGAREPQLAALDNVKVPTRTFGRTGRQVSILGLGGMFDTPSNQLLLHQAVKWGVTYWDTADCYEGGASERGIGDYFEKYPEAREKVFLVTKSDDRDPEGMTRLLDHSLERMRTDHIDLYFIHGLRSAGELDEPVRRWADRAKARGKIRHFGFSTHRNMEDLLLAAARLGWIDGIMMSYNFRLMQNSRMQEAVAACAEAGIGLTAMKTQGGGQVNRARDAESKMVTVYLKNGFTDKQVKLKAVWDNPHIASICSQMPNLTILLANVAAAVDKTRLSDADHRLLREFALDSRQDYCAGCTGICESCTGGVVPIGDTMRCLMYSRTYGQTDFARRLYQELPRAPLEESGIALAEQRCPQGLAIGRLLKEAAEEFG